MLSSSVRFRAVKKKITFWRCQWELGARNAYQIDVWPYWLTPTDSRRRDWLPVWCLTLLTDSDFPPTPRLTRWLTRTARRHPDWPAVTQIDCPAALHTIFLKFLFVGNVWGMWGMGQRVQQYFHKCKKNFYRTFLTLCLIPHIPHTF